MEQNTWAKCGFEFPCRKVSFNVLNCTVDIEGTKHREKFLEEFSLSGNPVPDYLKHLTKHHYGFLVVANILNVEAVNCGGSKTVATSSFKMTDSIGSKRIFSYWGDTDNECAKLFKSTKVRIKMSEDWCEYGKMAPTMVNFAEIESILK